MSQFKEDAHIEAIFNEIGFGSRVLYDIGAQLKWSNSKNLILNHGFTGTLVDGNSEYAGELKRNFPKANVINKFIRPEEVNDYCPSDSWFFSLDIDTCDWWMWANLRHRPAVVVVETNPLPGMFIAHMKCGRKDINGYGMSLDAANLLASIKGYDYIGRTEVNAIYVRKELNCKYRLPEMTEHHGAACKATNNVCFSE